MKRQEKSLEKNRRGRPSIGKGVQANVMLRPEIVSSIDNWAAEQPDQPSRTEAIRRLLQALRDQGYLK